MGRVANPSSKFKVLFELFLPLDQSSLSEIFSLPNKEVEEIEIDFYLFAFALPMVRSCVAGGRPCLFALCNPVDFTASRCRAKSSIDYIYSDVFPDRLFLNF